MIFRSCYTIIYQYRQPISNPLHLPLNYCVTKIQYWNESDICHSIHTVMLLVSCLLSFHIFWCLCVLFVCLCYSCLCVLLFVCATVVCVYFYLFVLQLFGCTFVCLCYICLCVLFVYLCYSCLCVFLFVCATVS